MRAIILAGGQGRRLRPYTTILPKPLMPVGEKPILEIVVSQLCRAGFTHLTFAVGYLGGLIQAYFGRGERFGIEVDYSFEEAPLGTAGPLSLLDGFGSDFLVMNGDLLTDVDYRTLMCFHKERGAICTVSMYRKLVPISLGVLQLNDTDNVVGYTEKPTLQYPVSMGIYCFRPEVLKYLPRNQHCDLPELVLRLIAAGEKVQAYRHEGRWLDIGRPEDYELAVAEFEKGAF